MKKKSTFFIVVIFSFCFYLLVSSISYASFSDSINLSGSAYTLEWWPAGVLPVEIIPYSSNRIVNWQTTNSNNMTFVSEVWNNNYYTATVRRNGTVTTRTVNYSLKITNTTSYTWVNGKTTSTERESYGGVNDLKSTLSSTVIAPGESFTITVTFSCYWIALGNKTQYMDTIVSFDVNGATRYFYITIVHTYG